MATAVYIKNVMEVLLYLPLNATCGKAELSEAGLGRREKSQAVPFQKRERRRCLFTAVAVI